MQKQRNSENGGKDYKELMRIEEFLSGQLVEYLSRLSQYNHIIEFRNIAWGDTTRFHSFTNGHYDIFLKSHSVDVHLPMGEDGSPIIHDTKIYMTLKKYVDNLIVQKIEDFDVQTTLKGFTRALKIVVEGYLNIHKNLNMENTYTIVFRMGIETL